MIFIRLLVNLFNHLDHRKNWYDRFHSHHMWLLLTNEFNMSIHVSVFTCFFYENESTHIIHFEIIMMIWIYVIEKLNEFQNDSMIKYMIQYDYCDERYISRKSWSLVNFFLDSVTTYWDEHMILLIQISKDNYYPDIILLRI